MQLETRLLSESGSFLLSNNSIPEPISKNQLESVDWETIRRQADLHKILPLVYRYVRSLDRQYSTEYAEQLQTEAIRITHRNARMADDLCHVFQQLEKEGIRALPYKGPSLSTIGYGHVSIRSFGDVDIILHEDDVIAAKNILQSHEYTHKKGEISKEEEQLKLNVDHQYSLQSPRGTKIELHWKTGPSHLAGEIDFERLWDRRESFEIQGHELPRPPTEELSMLLATHGSRHYWKTLGYLLDFTAVSCGDNLDWKYAIELAEEAGAKRRLLLALHLSNEIYGVEYSDYPFNMCQTDQQVLKLSNQCKKAIFDHDSVSDLDQLVLNYKSHERFSDQIEMVARLGFQPTERDYRVLPPRFRSRPMAALVRPFRATKGLIQLAVSNSS